MYIEKVINELLECNCIKQGSFVLKNDKDSKYYFNMKNLISYPKLLKNIGDELFKKLPDFDIICGIPYGGLPIASYISTTYNKPLIYVRDKQKSYGMNNLIEGEYKETDKCVIIDDVLTTGKSIKEVYEILKCKVNIVDIGVVIDRQQSDELPFSYKYLLCKTDLIRYYLNDYKKLKKSKICFSADIPDPNKLISLLNLIGDYIVVCKLHLDILDLNEYEGNFISDIIKLSIEKKFLIMEDRKFVDISYIVDKQYEKYKSWVDLVTVHGSCNPEIISKLSGVLLVANMSNNTFDYNDLCIKMAEKYNERVIGFVTQKRINCHNMICMTPGISLNNNNVNDQKYRKIEDVNTDFFIIGRAIYNSEDPAKSINDFLIEL